MYVRSMAVEVQVPGGLAAVAAGPELAALLGAVALPRVPNDRMLELLTAQYRQLCHEQARMAATLAELTRCRGVCAPGEVTREDEPDRYACDETRAALRWTRRAADAEHDLAETVVHAMPQLFAAWLAGQVDRPRVRVFCQYLINLTPGQVRRICAVAVPRAPKLTTGQLALLLRRMVIAVDPGAADRWYRQGIVDRGVTAYPDADGTITVSAHGLPADEAEAACQRIERIADAAKRAGHPGRIGQIRCDLFLGLLDGRFHAMTTEQVIRSLIADYRPTGPGGASADRPDGARPTASDAAGGPGASGGSGGDQSCDRSEGGSADQGVGPHGPNGVSGDGCGHRDPADEPGDRRPDSNDPRYTSPTHTSPAHDLSTEITTGRITTGRITTGRITTVQWTTLWTTAPMTMALTGAAARVSSPSTTGSVTTRSPTTGPPTARPATARPPTARRDARPPTASAPTASA